MKDEGRLRYAMSVDFEAMIDSGMTFEEAESWFKSNECIEESYENRWTAEEIQSMFEKHRSEHLAYWQLSQKK